MTPKKIDPLDRQKKFLSTQGVFKVYYDLEAFENRREAMDKKGVTPKEVMEAGLKAVGVTIKDKYSVKV